MFIFPSSKVKSPKKSRTVGYKYRPLFLIFLLSLILFGGIGSRLFFLQIKQGKENVQKAENNRIRILPKPPVRGNIFDSKGKILATTKLSRALYVWPKIQKDPDWLGIRHRLAEILNLSEEQVQIELEKAGYDSPTLLRLARNLTVEQVTALEEYRPELKGIEIDIETIRYYPHQATASHILGYTGELNQAQLAKKRSEGYRLGDVMGKMGVEESLESLLRGEWGGIQLEVDGAGRVRKIIGQKDAKAGQDVTLTLDLELQKVAEKALGERKGAIVALDPRTGAVLAMVSYPRFDPNIFSAPITTEVWRKLQGKGNPFVNRAIRGFPPASTFKIVTAAAGMETGKYPPNTILPTYAYLNVGGTRFGEWNRAGFGPMGYVQALAWSSNTFHGQIGRGIGGEALIAWARKFGFGQKTGIELSGELPGLIADDAWKRRNFKNWGWTEGDTINMSIGQGFTQATPLQVAVMFAIAGNGGYKVKPHLLLQAQEDALAERVSLNLKSSTIKTLKQGLRAVVTSGTGKALNVATIPSAAGKSGTAEAPPGKVHTWFGGFAPYDNPEIVVVAFGEHTGGGGGSVAGPMVRQVMEAYFAQKNKKP